MCKIQDRTKQDCNSNKRSKNRNVNNDNERKPSQSLIRLANEKISLLNILKSFNINIEQKNNYAEWSISIKCPLPSHKCGGEKTPSFGYNFKKDFFNCFGCGKSGGAVDFISIYKELSKLNVACQLLNEANIDIRNIEQFLPQNQIIEELLFDFSGWVQKNIQKNKNNIDQIEKVLWWFDHYIYENIPKNQVFVEDLTARIFKAKEVLKDL